MGVRGLGWQVDDTGMNDRLEDVSTGSVRPNHLTTTEASVRTVVIVPTYNEAENILTMIEAIMASEIAPDVLVVDDSSPDGTGALVTEAAADYPGRLHLLTRPGKQGLGAAYRAGFAEALRLGYDIVVQMDADGSHPCAALPVMARQIAAGATLVIGSRYCLGGAVAADWPWHRRALSQVGNTYARRMLKLPVRDVTGGFKMWHADTLASLDLADARAAGNAFLIQTTQLAVGRGAVVAEVPILFVDRTYGVSKMSRAVIVEAMMAVWRMRRETRRDKSTVAPATWPIAIPSQRTAPAATTGRVRSKVRHAA
jgi:dolichol-phosphate mannosyltransferase